MTSVNNPRRVEWSGPEGWIVWADEDGCHVRAASGSGALEEPDVERLFALWSEVKAARKSGWLPAPRPLTREERVEHSRRFGEAQVARRVIRAVKDEFGDDNDQPF